MEQIDLKIRIDVIAMFTQQIPKARQFILHELTQMYQGISERFIDTTFALTYITDEWLSQLLKHRVNDEIKKASSLKWSWIEDNNCQPQQTGQKLSESWWKENNYLGTQRPDKHV
jgi:5-methylcytosine-specific restriction endonuclease McrBC regulatory subunit McrC